MTVSEVLQEVRRVGIMLQADMDRLRVNAPKGALTPELRQALLEHKPALLQLLTAPPCPTCGVSDWRSSPDGGRWCVPCVVAGRVPVVAVKVHSAVLDTAIWVVADDLPQEAWPQDGAVVYTHAEVRHLAQVGPDTLAWVHATKTMFDAEVVEGGRRPAPTPLPLGEPPV